MKLNLLLSMYAACTPSSTGFIFENQELRLYALDCLRYHLANVPQDSDFARQNLDFSRETKGRNKKIYIEELKTFVYVFPSILTFSTKKYIHSKQVYACCLNMPSAITCFRKCVGCYALNNNYASSNVISRYLSNFYFYIFTRSDFLRTLRKELKDLPESMYVRLHSAGDFFSLQYASDIASIVASFQNRTFFTYTKKYDFVQPYFSSLKNMYIWNSLPHNYVNFGTKEYVENHLQEKDFLCKQCDKCLLTCKKCVHRRSGNPFFLIHA